MNTRILATCVLLVLASATLIPAGDASQLPWIKPCGNSTFHSFHPSVTGTPHNTTSDNHGRVVHAVDSCPISTGDPTDSDHDYDMAIGGGIFYASSTCGPAPDTSTVPPASHVYSWSPHHAFAPGSAYHVVNVIGSVAYTVGTDGDIPDPTDPTQPIAPCLGNNIVSDDATTDPWDCYQGTTGIYPGGPFATIGPNLASNTCDPADGYTVVFLHYGDVVVDSSGNTFISTPTHGTITG